MLAIGLMLITYFLFSCVDASAKSLVLVGLPAVQIAFARYFGHFVIAFMLVAHRREGFAGFGTDHKWSVLLRGFLLMLATVNNFFVLAYLPLTLTSTIMFSTPIIVTILSGPFLGEKVGPWRWLAIIIGFVGILIAMRPFDAGFHWAMPLAFLNAMFFAIYTLMTRKLAGSVSTETLQLYGGMVGSIVLAPIAILFWQNPASLTQWLLLLGIGLAGWASHEMMTRAHGFAPASLLSPFSYSFIIFMGFWGYIIFDHIPDRWNIIGAMIIAGAGILIWQRERRLSIKASIRPMPGSRL